MRPILEKAEVRKEPLRQVRVLLRLELKRAEDGLESLFLLVTARRGAALLGQRWRRRYTDPESRTTGKWRARRPD